MNECLDPKSRKKLEAKMLVLFGESMQSLSKECQMLLADDLVTAFENRVKVLNRAQSSMECYVENVSEIEHELIRA